MKHAVRVVSWFWRRRGYIVGGGAIICAVAVAVALPHLFAFEVNYWSWLAGDDSGSTTISNVALVLAGVIALSLAVWRARVASRQADTAQQGLLDERYQKGAEMLGSQVNAVRLGGIYALERLARDYPGQYHLQIMQLFCAFVRSPIRGPTDLPPSGFRQDVHAIVDAICARSEEGIAIERKVDFRLDLRNADLFGVQMLSADLSNAWFHGADLRSANIADTDLTDAFFSEADLSDAQFHRVNFTRMRLWSTNLRRASLERAHLTELNFHDTDLGNANLVRADLSRANFQESNLNSAWLEGATLVGASFLDADLTGAQLEDANLSDAHFLDSNLLAANLSNANLSGVQFTNAGRQNARELAQWQLDQAEADPESPPNLQGVLDTDTGAQLVWRGKPCQCSG